MSGKLKLCVDCLHHRSLFGHEHVCARGAIVSLVDGLEKLAEYPACSRERSPGWLEVMLSDECGRAGRHFKPSLEKPEPVRHGGVV
jgi:hypothetical protein